MTVMELKAELDKFGPYQLVVVQGPLGGFWDITLDEIDIMVCPSRIGKYVSRSKYDPPERTATLIDIKFNF
jgi:hypothetical protein